MITALRIVLSFAAVGGLLWFFARASRGRLGELLSGSLTGARAEPIAIVDRRQLSRTNSVAIVRAGERHLLLGVGDGGIRLLAEGDDLIAPPAEEEPVDTVEPAPPFRLESDLGSARTRLPRADRPNPPRTSVIETLRSRTVRRT